MRRLLISAVALLGACRAQAPLIIAAPTPTIVSTEPTSTRSSTQGLPQSTALLPSIQRMGVAPQPTPLLARPQANSTILKTLAAGTPVQLLGNIDNADGRWLSVAFEQTQGWVRAAQIIPSP